MAPGGIVYHVYNRGSRKAKLFDTSAEYTAFVRLLDETRSMRTMRIIAYCLMPNHWHFLLWPEKEGELPKFMHRLTTTHAVRSRRETVTTGEGAVYQSRYNAVPVQGPFHLATVWRYIERNPIAGGLVVRAEDWSWSSAGQLTNPSPDLVLDLPPFPRPPLSFVNLAETEIERSLLSAYLALAETRETPPTLESV